jgi:hypothetical protein
VFLTKGLIRILEHELHQRDHPCEDKEGKKGGANFNELESPVWLQHPPPLKGEPVEPAQRLRNDLMQLKIPRLWRKSARRKQAT